jgi:DNA repair protein RadA/Sms
MAKEMTHSCADCGFAAPKWFGKCPECGSWSTKEIAGSADEVAVVPLTGNGLETPRLPTGLSEVDRVLSGGFVRGQVCLLAGEPGIGKSTIVLQLIDTIVRAGGNCLLVTGEESVPQVALRAKRLGCAADDLRATATTSVMSALTAARKENPALLVVDSIQTLFDPELDSVPGSVTQVRGCAARLVAYAKETGVVVVIVGHVTKEGAVAGPKILEHVVDTVLTIEGERNGGLRLLRAIKNRFGSCEETGVFSMTGSGLEAVPDPSSLLLADRGDEAAPGSIVFPQLEGKRPLLVEIQALVAPTALVQPRRVVMGLESARLSLLVGVLARRADQALTTQDVFVSAAGGIAVREPAVDLPLCLALVSAASDFAIPRDVVAMGEVGLGGELRRVPGIERRLSEAARLGFRTAIVPKSVTASVDGIQCHRVPDLRRALEHLLPRVSAA